MLLNIFIKATVSRASCGQDIWGGKEHHEKCVEKELEHNN